MKTQIQSPYSSVAAAVFAIFSILPLNAAVITDPPLVTTGNKIAPYSTGVTAVADGATAESTLEARSDLSVLQDFSSFSGADNIVSFTSATLPDISITGGFGAPITNNSFLSSTGSAMRIQTAATGSPYTHTVMIDFGIYADSTFAGSEIGVEAAAFMLNSTPTYVDATASITATFYSLSNQVLSEQTFIPTGSTSNSRIYFGYESLSNTISSIKIDITSTASGNALIYGFDDLAFTQAIPEPSSAALLLGATLLAFAARRRLAR